MNAARAALLENGLTAVAKKVYACVPISEPWDSAMIHAELVRTTSHRDFRVTEGCLYSLIETGLVRRVGEKPYGYIRVFKPVVNQPKAEVIHMVQSVKAPEPSKKDSLAELAEAPKSLRAMSKLLTELADDIEVLTGELAEKLAVVDKSAQTIEALKALLK